MSDYNSSLPVRTEAAGDVIAKIADATTPSQQLAIDSAGKVGVKVSAGDGTSISHTGSSLDVNVTSAITTGAVDRSSFTYGTTSEQTIGGVFQDTSPTVTAGQQAAARITANRALHINLRDASGNQLGDSNADGLWVRPGDGTNAQSFTAAGEVKASITQSLPAGTAIIGKVSQDTSPWVVKDQADGPVTPGTVASFSQLIGGQYNSSLPTLTSTQQSAFQLDSSGRLIIAPLASSSIVTVSNLPTTVDTNYGTVGASTIRTAAQLGNATGAADFNAGATGAQTIRVVANQGAANATPWNENIAQIAGAAPSATNALPSQIATAGAFVSETNPLPVEIAIAGTPINDYKQASSIAAAASDNHDYTVTALKSLHLTQIEGAGSGKAKMEVQIESGVGTGTFASKFVQFNSTAETNMEIVLSAPIVVAAGVRVRVIMTNRDLLSQDLYSTISGHEE